MGKEDGVLFNPGLDFFRNLYERETAETDIALRALGFHEDTSPGSAWGVGPNFLSLEELQRLPTPYSIEILGMPFAGKTTALNRYIRERMWPEGRRPYFHIVPEGAGSIKLRYGELLHQDPLAYTHRAHVHTLIGYQDGLGLDKIPHAFIADRGPIDTITWVRAHNLCGRMPRTTTQRHQLMQGYKDVPMNTGAIIMFQARPHISLQRENGKGEGPIMNEVFLKILHEQYWRLHYEILSRDVPSYSYTCINAEGDPEEVYRQFAGAMDIAVSMRGMFLPLLAERMPEAYKRILSRRNTREGRRPIVSPVRGRVVLGDETFSGIRVGFVNGQIRPPELVVASYSKGRQ